MTRSRLFRSIALGACALLLAGGAVFVHRLLYTTEGLDLLLRQLGHLQTVRIEVTGTHGVLAGPLSADRIVVDHEAVHIEARRLRLHPRWGGALTGLVSIDGVSIGDVAITLKEREKQPESETHFLPAWLRLAIPDFNADNVSLTLASGTRYAVRRVQGTARITRWRIDVEPFAVDDPLGRLAGEVFLRGTNPLGLRGKVDGHWQMPDARTYRFSAEVRGDLHRLGTDFKLAQPAQLSFAGNLLDLSEQLKVSGVVRMTNFDGAPWVPAGTLPALSGSLGLITKGASVAAGGTLTSPAIDGGQVRIRGRGGWHDETLDVSTLRIWLPRLQMALTTKGTVTFGDKSPTLALAGEWEKLRWPLSGDATVESIKGAYTIGGATPYRFTIKGDVRGPAIPAADFTAAGSLDSRQLLLDRVDGAVMKGTLQGSGQLTWSGDQAWQFRIAGKGLDVSQVRPEVQGRVSVAGSIAGQGFGEAAPWTARIASMSGTLFDRALTGRGEISHRGGAFELKDVRISNGTSNVDVNGVYGEVMDLRWDANLQSLAIVAPGMTGKLVSNGRLQGTLEKPELTGEAHIRDLRYGDVVIDKADATLDIDVSDRRASRIDVRATDALAGGVRFDALTLQVSGLTREHGLDLEIVSPGSPDRRLAEFHGKASASGHYDAVTHAWSGQLTQTTVTFPDGQAKLLQPSALEIGPERVRVEPLCIEAGDSRLCVEGERNAQPESWKFIYSAQDWPLKRILRTLFGRQDFDGSLQASGWAEKSPGQDWIGGTTMILDHPVLEVARNKFRTERVELGGGRLDAYAEPTVIRANVDLNPTENTRIHGEAVADRRPGADLLSSPLRGTLHGESAALTSLPLLVPEIDRSSGTLDGDVTIGGTLGEPRFNGGFRVRDGRFELYRTNFVLAKVQLDGNFIGDELTFDGRGETAKGPVSLDGRFNWPDGVMTGTMRLKGENLLVADTPEYRVFASPNLTLRAGSDGYDVEGEVVIPTAKISPKDLSTSVGTSPDERVVDIEVEDNGPATVQRIRSRIHVVLGDSVRVDSYGLKARLDGEVTVLTKPDDVARGLGAINVVEGQYKAFGQDVKITKGKLSYNNTPLGEPMLELTAERAIRDTDITVAVNVRGSLAKPFITVTSTPAMSSNEALSYLLTGRSIDTLQSGEVSSVNKAAENLAVSGGGLLLGGIGSKLGLDELSLERDSNAETSVTLGKALSPKLFVSYGVSIAEAINTIKLRYTLNQRWSLKAEAGLDQSADIEYKIER